MSQLSGAGQILNDIGAPQGLMKAFFPDEMNQL